MCRLLWLVDEVGSKEPDLNMWLHCVSLRGNCQNGCSKECCILSGFLRISLNRSQFDSALTVLPEFVCNLKEKARFPAAYCCRFEIDLAKIKLNWQHCKPYTCDYRLQDIWQNSSGNTAIQICIINESVFSIKGCFVCIQLKIFHFTLNA